MNVEGKTYMFYDKFCGDHGLKNPLTKNITIEELFNNGTYIEGKKVITEFNKFGGISQIQEDIDEKLYNFYFFTLKVQTSEAKVTIVSVNNELLEKHVKNNSIPNEKFLIDLCTYHNNYNKKDTQNLTIQQRVKLSVDEIVKISTQPNSDVTDQMVEDPKFAKHKMYNYQKRTVKWMLDKELNNINIPYSFNDEIIIGNVVYDALTKKFMLCEDKKKLLFKGGALIDEVGLGKTYQMLALSMLNPAKNISYYQDDINMICSRATLILCPNQLCGQWIREVEKMIDTKYKIVVIPMLTKNHHDKFTYLDLLDADFVVVSYNFLGNNCYTGKWLNKVSSSKSYCKSADFNIESVDNVLKSLSKEYKDDPVKLFESNPILNIINWHRIIVDEFHEIYTVKDKYNHVANLLRFFSAKYKWCVSGTPFDKGPDSLVKMINYTTNYTLTSASSEKVLINDEIKNYMIKNFFRRNTKKSVTDEYKLDPLKENIVLLKFTQTERMMYNAYLANPTMDKFSVLMRQLCCHPKIADEIKDALSNCKTLEDMEKSMVKYYEKAYLESETGVKLAEYRIKKTERKITVAEYKRQRRFLKQTGKYKVYIEFPPQIKNPKFDDMFDNENANENDDGEKNDSSTDSDDEKELIIINEDNQKMIINKIKKKLDENPSNFINDLHITLQNWQTKLVEAKKIYEGKKTTYNFFANVLTKLKKTGEKKEGDDEEEDEDAEVCGICLGNITGNDVGVTKCGHIFCYQCLKATIIKSAKCPSCLGHIKENEIFMISYEKPVTGVQTKDIKDKLSLINEVGTKLANMIFYIRSIKEKCIVFSQWDDLLKKVGDVLDTYGIKNVFCRGNVWTRDKAIREFSSKDEIRVIMLSSESAASGTNLTAASTVILLDPVYGSYEYRRNTEWQAIGRAYRMGQQKPVTVARFIIKDTVEEEIYNMNKDEDKKFNENIKIFELNDDKITLEKDQIENMAKHAEEALKKKTQKSKKTDKKIELPKDLKNAPIVVNNNVINDIWEADWDSENDDSD